MKVCKEGGFLRNIYEWYYTEEGCWCCEMTRMVLAVFIMGMCAGWGIAKIF